MAGLNRESTGRTAGSWGITRLFDGLERQLKHRNVDNGIA